MRELKVGDSVWIRDDLVEDKLYGVDGWVNGMKKGSQVTVKTKLENNCFLIESDERLWTYTHEMVDWNRTNATRADIDPNIIKYKEIFDELLEVGFTRDEALKIMLNAGNVGKNAGNVGKNA